MQPPHPFTLTVAACATQAHHFRWEIRRGARPMRSSALSFPRREDATVEGLAALRHVIAAWRGERATRSRPGGAPRATAGEARASTS